MAFSDTIGQTVFSTRRVMDSAFRRCKLPAQTITAEHIDIAKDQLFLFLGDLANQGAPLWCVTKTIYPLYDGVDNIITYAGTVDILNGNFRRMSAVTGTNTDTATSHKVQFTSSTRVDTVGVLWSGLSSPLIIERSDDGVTWVQEQSFVDPGVIDGVISWYDIDNAIAATYIRVSSSSGNLNATSVYTLNNPSEVLLSRMNRDDYVNIPNKTYRSNQPLQYWLDRQALSPVMRLWPVPLSISATCQVVVWAHRHIMDVGTMTQELEVPQRWYEAVVSGLASKLAVEVAEVDPQMIPILDSRAADALYKAQAEERDNSPFNLTPAIGAYTR